MNAQLVSLFSETRAGFGLLCRGSKSQVFRFSPRYLYQSLAPYQDVANVHSGKLLISLCAAFGTSVALRESNEIIRKANYEETYVARYSIDLRLALSSTGTSLG